MRIQHNIMAMNAYRNYNNNTSALSKNLEKLSSGYKINRAGDDAAGLAISEKMRAQITGLNAASKNVKDGISLVKTGEGAMQEIQDMLNRMDYLATQSANGTYDNEVDRANLQKEVKALKDEINRIADSANFNGIKLLDGKTGLNNNAFTLSSEAAVNAVNPGAITISFAAETAGNNDFHGTLPAVGAQTAEFTIDLGDLSVDASGGDATLTVTFGNQAVTVTLNSKGGANGDGKWSAASIADALVTKLNSNTVTLSNGTNTVGAASIGTYNFQASAVASSNGGTGNVAIKFTFLGQNGKEIALDDLSEAQAEAINRLDGVKGGDVSIGVSAGNLTGTYNHKVDDVQQAVAKDPGQKAGITFDITADMLKEDVELVIDGTTFTFLTDTSNTAPATSTQIDLRDVIKAGGNTTAQLTEAIDQLSQKSTTNFDITKKDNGKIHIEQKASSNEEYDYKRLTSDEVVKATNNGAAKPAKNAGTGITIDSNSVAYGDKLTIGGKTFVFQNDDSKVGADEKQVNGKTATDLMNAINNDSSLGLTAELDPNNSNKVIVRSSAAGNTAPAPLVGGTGLTLQIGDTSDSFNQMNLQIKNMHVNAMGTMDASGNVTKSIADIDISTQAGAQEAVDVIKNAINYVSSVRGDLGAIQNRLEHTGNNLSVMAENIQDAESTIRDTDVAEEMMSYVKNNILVQSAQAMLAQANQVPQGVLQLLG